MFLTILKFIEDLSPVAELRNHAIDCLCALLQSEKIVIASPPLDTK